MKTKLSPAVVGFFVLGAVTLGLIALFSFGSLRLLTQPQRFVATFDESTHGLDLGSPVKLRGVRVGRVVSLNLRYLEEENKSVVDVVGELSRDTITDETGDILDLSDPAVLQKLVDAGLRAQLGVIGLATGMLYVELDMRDPLEHPPMPHDAVHSRYPVVPTVRSAIAEFQASLTEILAAVKMADLPGLATEFRGLLVDTRRQVNALDTAPLLAEWTAAGRAVTEMTASLELAGAVENFNATLTALRGTLAQIDAAVEPVSTDLAGTLREARAGLAAFTAAAEGAERFIAAQGGLGREAALALRQLNEAAAAVARLADFLERNPNALLSGRAKGER
jgi:paraquat-inducible protein B